MTYRLGIIGAGYITDVALSPAVHALAGEVELVAVHDSDPAHRARAALAHPGTRVTDDIDAFFGAGLDGVHIATPNNTHACFAQAALYQNVHVLLEKPAAHDPAAAEDIARAAAANPVVCVLGYMFKHAPAYQHALALIRQGRIGSVQAVIGTYPGWRKTDWHDHRAHSGLGCLTDLGSYPIATATDLLGTEVDRIQATAWPQPDQDGAETYAAGTVWYRTGARLQFETTGIFNDDTEAAAGTSQLTVVGTDGYLQLRGIWNMGWPVTLVVHDRRGWDETRWDNTDVYVRQYRRFFELCGTGTGTGVGTGTGIGTVPVDLSIERGVHDLRLLRRISDAAAGRPADRVEAGLAGVR